MEENKAVNKPKKKLSKSAIVLIACCIIILVPCIIFASMLIIPAMQGNTPRNGSRFENDLEPAISQEEVASLKDQFEKISGVELVDIELAQGQLRIYLDIVDSADESKGDSILTDAYNLVNKQLPIKTYFTSSNAKKMYDLNINVYTNLDTSQINRYYKLLHKNAFEEEYGIDNLAHPKNPELAHELANPEQVDNVENQEESVQ